MSYLTVNDLKMKVDERTLIELTDTTGAGVVDTASVERAIRDASAIVDSLAGKHFRVPFNPVPHAVADAVAALAIRSLHRFRNLSSPAWERAGDEAISFLGRLADGSATLDGAVEKPAASDSVSSTVALSGPGRLFSRDLLKGM